MTDAFDLAFEPFVDGSTLLALSVFCVATALVVLLACRFASNQRAIRHLKNIFQARLLELRLFPDQLGVVGPACGKLLRAALGYLGWSLVPLAVAAVPVALLIPQMELRFGFRPLPPGVSTLLVVHLDDPAAVNRVALEYPEGVVEIAPLVRLPGKRSVVASIQSRLSGRVEIVVHAGETQVSKEIVTGAGLQRLSPERVRGGWLARLRQPGEELLPRAGCISSITLQYPARLLQLGPVELNWLVVYFLLTLAAGIAMRPFFGAGFEFLSPLFALPLALFQVVWVLLTWPLRRIWRLRRGRRANRVARVERIVIVGFDGMDPELAARWMRLGKLPHLARLAKSGTFRPLAATHPPVSHVAWSTFVTGVNPGKHNIFDSMGRDRHTYLPFLSSAQVLGRRHWLRRGRLSIPFGLPESKALRKSKPFWHYLGEAGVFSSVIRVPATFPPEPFSGVLLSGMGVPDLRGGHGTFSLFSSRQGAGGKLEGGVLLPLVQEGDEWCGELIGLENPFSEHGPRDLTLPLRIRPHAAHRRAEVEIDGRRMTLRQGEFSGWIALRYRAGIGAHVQGMCRMVLKSLHPDVELYVTPVQIDPRCPALPVSHPLDYSAYLSKLQGAFSTLGLAEDMWAMNHGVLDDRTFLEQCYQIHAEREQMFFDALEKTRRGACICVFDITDRVQHMFWRNTEPSRSGGTAAPPPRAGEHEPPGAGVIESLYQRMDALVGRVLDRAGPEALVLVVSDHGFKSFCRAFNLNAWLHEQGYLALVSGSTVSEEWFRQVDWQHTRVYGMAMNALYLNLAGRERHGIVQPGEEADALLAELREKLRGITDPANGQVAVREVFDIREVYSGPYRENAPDLLIGYAAGYRAPWETVNGSVMGEIFLDNTRPWSGDHCMDPREVPGVLFANRPILGDRHSIADVAPTILQLFGLPVPSHMDGRPWTVRMEARASATGGAAAPAPPLGL